MKSYSAENRSERKIFKDLDFLIFRFVLYYFSNSDMKQKGETEIKVNTRGMKAEKLQMIDEFNIDELEFDFLKQAIQTK